MDNFDTKKTALMRPFIYKKASITNISIRVIILLFIQIILLFSKGSFSALIVILCTTLGGLFAFLSRYFLKKDSFHTIFQVVLQGMLIGFLLPETYPPFVALLITFFTILVCKYIFSVYTNLWTNIIALAVIIAWFIGKEFFPTFLITDDIAKLRNPSLYLIQNGTFPLSQFDTTITDFFNKNIFKFLKVSVPKGYVSLLWDSQSAIPAFRFGILTLLSSLFLYSDDTESPLIPSVFIFVYLICVRLFAPIFYGGSFNSGDIILAMFSSGTLFCAVFLVQYFGTVPQTFFGKLVLAISYGFLAFLICGQGTSSVGMVFTILVGNLLTLLITCFENHKSYLSLCKMLSNQESEV